MRIWKVTTAALAMVLGAGQAQAARFVEYRVPGSGTATIYSADTQGRPTTETRYVYYSATIVLDLDRPGEFYGPPTVEGVSAATYFIDGDVAFQNITQNRFAPVFNIRADTFFYYREYLEFNPYSQTRDSIVIQGDAFGQYYRDVAGSADGQVVYTLGAFVPEPATWGLMLLGFGLIGAGLRSRRRTTTVTYA